MDNYERMLELLDTKEGKELINCIMKDAVEQVGFWTITKENTIFSDDDLLEIEYYQSGYRFLKNLLEMHKDERKEVY